ncbi:MAG: GAF domain-containing protein, partial [Deltaproteobacteria bacterium]|nr:GAF domain-containing protein [Deltaproteobacteria bacterium]
MSSGELLLIRPLNPPDDRTLAYLARQLEEDLEFCKIFDNICRANLAISSHLALKPLLHKVMSLTEEILNAEVSAVILQVPGKDQLYWELSRGDKADFFERECVSLPVGTGIAGHVFHTGSPVLSNDPTKDPRWCPDFDKKSGFRTRSLLCVPLKFRGNTIGVIEIINRAEGKFTRADLRLLEVIASQAASAIENAKVYEALEEAFEKLQSLDKAKERVINHLSHELKTPLAVISSAFGRIHKELSGSVGIEKIEKALARGRRNVERLLVL